MTWLAFLCSVTVVAAVDVLTDATDGLIAVESLVVDVHADDQAAHNAFLRASFHRGDFLWVVILGAAGGVIGAGYNLAAFRLAWMRKRISPAQDEWSAFVLAWYLAFVSTPATATELFNLADDEGLLDTARGAGNERSQKTKIGIALRGMTDRNFSVIDPNTGQDMTLQVTDGGAQTRTRAKTYRLVKV